MSECCCPNCTMVRIIAIWKENNYTERQIFNGVMKALAGSLEGFGMIEVEVNDVDDVGVRH